MIEWKKCPGRDSPVRMGNVMSGGLQRKWTVVTMAIMKNAGYFKHRSVALAAGHS